jgi:RING finger protein 170
VTRTNHPFLNSREEWKQSENFCSIKISMSARNATPAISPDQQQTHQNDNSASEQATRRSRENGGVGFKKPSYLNRDGPPLDYGCPICSGT